jgi:prophage regulatory protein
MSSQQRQIKEIFKAGCFSRQSKLAQFLPFSTATMWRRCKEGTFPKPQKLSPNVTVWNNDELNLWFAEQAEMFNGGKQ